MSTIIRAKLLEKTVVQEMSKTFVIKRDGTKQAVSFDKVNWRIQNLCGDLDEIDPIPIAQKVIAQIYNGVHTSELDELTAKICASLATENLQFGELAKRIIISNNHKNTSPSFSETVSLLYHHHDVHGNHVPIVSRELFDFVMENKAKFNSYIDYQRDYLFDYFGYKTLERGYLKKIGDNVIERPQHMIMRVSIGLNIGDVKMALETYDCISQKYYTVATPGLFHLGTPRSQAISCFNEDTIVYTENRGKVRIADVLVGDTVITHTGKIRRVLQVHKNPLADRKMYSLTVDDGSMDIKVTGNHRFYCLEDDGFQWVRIDAMKVGETKIGQWVKNIDNGMWTKMYGVVSSLTEIDTRGIDWVYTLGVEDDHSYNVEGLICENCFLLGTEDSIDGMYKTISDCAKISKWAGGIGAHISNIRSQGMLIRGTNGYSDGIIPMLRVYNNTARHVNQCFIGDTVVFTDDGAMRIADVVAGQRVLTRDGTWKEVNHVFNNECNQKLVNYRHDACFEPVRCTPVHQIYVLANRGHLTNRDLLYNVRAGTVKPEFVDASNIGVGDLVAYPMPKPNTNTNTGNSERNSERNNEKGIEESVWELKGDNDLYYLYGCIIGHGHLETSMTRTFASLRKYTVILDPTMDHHRIKMENIKVILAGKGIPFKNYYENDKLVIYWKRCAGEEWDIPPDAIIRDGVKRMHVGMFLESSEERIRAFIGGLLDGTMQIKTVNRLIAREFVYLFLRIGVLVECHSHDVLETDKIYRERNSPGQCIYDVVVPWDRKLEAVVDFNVRSTDFTDDINDLEYFEYGGLIWTPIREIWNDSVEYTGRVYDLNIHRNHNYTIDGGLVHNSGKRPGAFAIYLEPHHPEIMEFLELKKNEGDVEARCRDLFLAVWLSDYFMECVENDSDWGLLDPDKCPGLQDAFGDDYAILYKKYVEEGKAKRMVKARDIWNKIVDAQIETGVPYVLYKDSINRKSNQQHYGIIRSSNLCAEITLYSDAKEYACCVLSSLCLPLFVDEEKRVFDHNRLVEVIRVAVHNLNRIIDLNFYPVEETRISNERHRPLGLGVQGLADVFMMLDMPFASDEAKRLNREIFETIYYGAMRASCDIAKRDGVYPTYAGSPVSQGRFQFDLWGVEPSDRWDWNQLRKDIGKWGVRNSTLVALMPTASTSQIMGNNEAFEPYTSNIYVRRTLAGDFVIVNQHLIKRLSSLGLWNREMKDAIIACNGSVQTIDGIPDDIKEVFRTVWEIKQKDIIDMARDRGPFVCQTQSMNLFFEEPTRKILNNALFYGWKQGLKTGSYYIRSRPRVQAQQFTIAPSNSSKPFDEKKTAENEHIEELKLACSRANPGACEMCSS